MYVGGWQIFLSLFVGNIFYEPSRSGTDVNTKLIWLVWELYECITIVWKATPTRKKENGIEIEDVPMDPYIKSDISRFTWNGCSHARARVSAAGYIGHSIRSEIGPITHVLDMWLLKKYLLVPILRSPFVHQYPDYILKAIFATPVRANSLLPTHRAWVGKKRGPNWWQY